jgi:tyrosyl-tRNA synthetase
MGFVEELAWRGLVHQQTDAALGAEMQKGPMTLYIGFDPSAPTLHVGSLLQILVLIRAERAGHKVIAVVGGATGMIGDPSGKTEERKLLDVDTLRENVDGIRNTLGRFLDFDRALLRNNYDWLSKLQYLEFLRDVGKLFSVNMMLGKESVRARLEDREHGISYTEFSYMLIQAYDFLWLYEKEGCRLQCGASDQWGNITAGIDLIRRRHSQAEVYGLTTPLVTDSAGQKFGKTEKGAVWLDAGRTSPYDFFQFFLRTEDRDVGRFLRYFTFFDEKQIVALEETVHSAPEKREAQRVLAREVTTLVHGKEETHKAEEAARALFAGDLGALDAAAIEQMFRDAPSSESKLGALVDLLVETKLCPSKSAARRDIEAGSIYVNDKRAGTVDIDTTLGPKDLLAGKFLVLRRGKKSYHLVRHI